MERAVGVGPNQLDANWPGRVFRYPDEGYNAILATPHGRGVVHLIIQHADGLPGKDIDSITMFTTPPIEADGGDGSKTYNMLFTLSG